MQQRKTNTKRFAAGGRLAATAAAAGVLLLGACDSGDDDADTGTPELTGTWDATDSNVTWTVTDDVITTTFGGGIETAYMATGATIEMGDESGSMACASGQIGVYEWEVDDDVLTLTLVSDDCSGRAGHIDGLSLQRSG